VRELVADELLNLPGVKVKPLPHRQLRALEETLPGAGGSVSPYLKEVTGAKLAAAGVISRAHIGDKSGLYLGFTRPDAQLVFTDLSPTAPLTGPVVIAGDDANRRSQVTAGLAHQATAAGARIVVLTAGESVAQYKQVAPLVTAEQVLAHAGAIDPFTRVDADAAARISLYLLAEAAGESQFSADAQAQLVEGARHAAVLEAKAATAIMTGVRDPGAQAKIAQLRITHPAVAAAFGRTDQPTSTAPTALDGNKSAVIDATEADVASVRFLARTLLALAASRPGLVVVVDGITDLFSAPDASAWLSGARYQTARVIIAAPAQHLATNADTVAGFGPRLVLGSTEATLSAALIGLSPEQALTDWWKEQASGRRPLSSGIFRDADGHVTVLSAAPLAQDHLEQAARPGTRPVRR
jgi:hypothetical protein